MTSLFLFVTVFLSSLLSFNSEELSCKDPKLSGIKQGVFSRYDQSPTDGTIAYHQEVDGALPLDMSGYAGVVAVEDCSLVGRDAWIRITDDRANPWALDQWRPVLVFDCSGHDSTSNWMAAFNILGELGYYFTEEIGMYGEYNIEGDIAFEDPALAEACGYTEMYTPKEQSNALAKIYIEDSNPPPILTPLPIDDPESIPALLTALPPPASTATARPLPTIPPTPTPQAVLSPVATVIVVSTLQPPLELDPEATVAPAPAPKQDPTYYFSEDDTDRIIFWIVVGALALVAFSLFLAYLALRAFRRKETIGSLKADNERLLELLDQYVTDHTGEYE